MLFAIDIDGTLAWANLRHYVQYCNRCLDLGISETTIAEVRSYDDFLALPELAVWRERDGNEQFERRFGWMRFDYDVLIGLHPFHGASEQVKALGARGDVYYYTARSCSFSEEKDRTIQQATYDWLEKHGFPRHEVVFCAGVRDKLQRLARHAEDIEQSVVLIDDHGDLLIQELNHLEPVIADKLQNRLRLVVAHKTATLPACFPVYTMPAWKDFPLLLQTMYVKQGE